MTTDPKAAADHSTGRARGAERTRVLPPEEEQALVLVLEQARTALIRAIASSGPALHAIAAVLGKACAGDRAARSTVINDLREEGVRAETLQCVRERERVHHRRQHSHVVGGGAVHAPCAGRQSPEDVAASDHDRQLDAELADLDDLRGNLVGHRRVDAEVAISHQRFAGELQEDALIGRSRHENVRIIAQGVHTSTGSPTREGGGGVPPSLGLAQEEPPFFGRRAKTGSYSCADPQSVVSPTLRRAKWAMVMFSPSLATAAETRSPIETLGSRMDGWSSNTICW